MINSSNINFFDDLKNMNYDSSFKCTYKLFEDDEDGASHICYQTQLLQALNMKKFDDFIIAKNIEAVYFFLKNYNEIIELLVLLKEKYKNTSLAFFIENNIALFQLLFSYDYFDVFHKCLCDYIKSKTQKKDSILEKKYFDNIRYLISID
jgi:hypothetical protein